ncbi:MULTISPECIES: tetratricopeptide repeat protein [Cyanophyceae]|uniref:tetratricopeptide repeat protein n=1 Tax=Cyanophyceae TaxID=3028117 RepID=UPI00168740A9|nr:MULTISPECIES: tetratricopeptide repeat protein [Cyanophyceae]MBD1915693.1 tetratricopeptide repeat protein [Phormidium sp. FACHB-77]MBD2029058.1 tetratricopeptide repeat protein [Phormidium sp. FACHB-322]MBD2052185.1 tetratricopeptide repeat protein [Leptolyngbya sp. FACHB-60]
METMVRDRQILPIGLRSNAATPQGHLATVPRPLPFRDDETVAMGQCELGKIRLEMGRFQDALELFEQALALQPHDVESWLNRAEALTCLSRYEDALASLEQVQTLAGFATTRLLVQKAVVLIWLNRLEAALTCCNRALWLNPDHSQAWLFRGVALQRLGRNKEAHRSYRRVAQPALAAGSHSNLQRLCQDIVLNHQAD